MHELVFMLEIPYFLFTPLTLFWTVHISVECIRGPLLAANGGLNVKVTIYLPPRMLYILVYHI
jgi:hypothetical protein